MIAFGPELKIMVSAQPVDFRNYVERRIMRSPEGLPLTKTGVLGSSTPHNLSFYLLLSMAKSLSGGRNRPALRLGAEVAFSASNFSVGSARR